MYKIKIVCYNLFDDGFDFQITEVYQIENYDYNIHSENEDPAVIIAKGVRDGYTQREIEALLQNNKFDDGQIFKRFSPQSGRYYRLKNLLDEVNVLVEENLPEVDFMKKLNNLKQKAN